MNKEKVFVIIVNFNGEKTIIDSLKSVKNWQVVVVDNGSNDGSIDKIKNLKLKIKNLTLIENKKNLGFAGGANLGINQALKNGANSVLLLNQDAVVKKGAIEKLIKVMEKDKKIGICGPLILAKNKKIWSAGGIIDKKRFTGGHLFKVLKKKPYEADFISGCAMCIKKDVFGKIGLFDERYFLYYEDVDFCARAKNAGFKVVVVSEAIIYHQPLDGKKEKIRQYYMARNHLLFLEKHGPLRIKLREMLRLPKTIYGHLKRAESDALLGIRDYFIRSKTFG